MKSRAIPQGQDSVLHSLFAEIFQTERSAFAHCAREAARVDASVAFGLGKASAHAEGSLRMLDKLAAQRGYKGASLGKTIGQTFSEIRDKVVDRFVSAQTSYRATLLGMRHGYDVFLLAHAAAVEEGDKEFAAFASWWLATRGALIEDVAHELRWFATHPQSAMRRSMPLLHV